MTTEEQTKWVKTQMHGFEIVKNKENKKDLKEEIVYKYSNKTKGHLRESVIISGLPYFIRYGQNVEKNKDYVLCEPKIEEGIKTLRPPYEVECPFIPYEFKTAEVPNQYLQRAKQETVDSIYQKIKSMVMKLNDIDEKTKNLFSANILSSYFQDRFSTVHYLIVVGANGTGKSAFGNTFECLGYRAVNITNATESFWFRIFGTNEPGQVTIIAEEVDKMDESSQIMGILKEGYQPKAKIPRMNTDNSKMDFFYPFGIKIMIGEKSPNEDTARGLLDRSFKIKSYKGYPDYDIKEIMNPQGNIERQQLFDEMMDLRKLLLMFRLVHFKDPYKEIDIGLDGRDRELCKPMIQLFYTLGASEETLRELEATLQHFLDIKNKRKGQTLEAVIYPTIVNFVSQNGQSVSSTELWRLITDSIEGERDDKNSNLFYSSDYGKIFRNSLTRMICDKFGAEIDHRRDGNNIIFDLGYLTKTEKIYQSGNMRTRPRPVHNDESPGFERKCDSVTQCDHLEERTPIDNNLLEDKNVEDGRANSGDHDESLNHTDNHIAKCPKCGYEDRPFYLKVHLKNQHGIGMSPKVRDYWNLKQK
jgi:hypothetical protein